MGGLPERTVLRRRLLSVGLGMSLSATGCYRDVTYVDVVSVQSSSSIGVTLDLRESTTQYNRIPLPPESGRHVEPARREAYRFVLQADGKTYRSEKIGSTLETAFLQFDAIDEVYRDAGSRLATLGAGCLSGTVFAARLLSARSGLLLKCGARLVVLRHEGTDCSASIQNGRWGVDKIDPMLSASELRDGGFALHLDPVLALTRPRPGYRDTLDGLAQATQALRVSKCLERTGSLRFSLPDGFGVVDLDDGSDVALGMRLPDNRVANGSVAWVLLSHGREIARGAEPESSWTRGRIMLDTKNKKLVRLDIPSAAVSATVLSDYSSVNR
jgi:hypothetical protein